MVSCVTITWLEITLQWTLQAPGHEGVKVATRHSAVEVDRLQVALEHRRTSCSAAAREAQRRQSQMATARGRTNHDDSTANV